MIEEVPTFEATWSSQRDLVSLSAPRPLELPAGWFAGNGFYGSERVLTRFAGLPSGYRVRAVIPHGINLDAGFVWAGEVQAKLPAVMSFPAYRHSVYSRITSKHVVPAASPYLYALEELRQFDSPSGRLGVIFFPEHSTHHLQSSDGTETWLRRLSVAQERYSRVTVCMYWRDIELGRHDAYQRAGFQIVSAGHIYDPMFLYRLHWLCASHEYSAGAALGSHIFYSILSGCSYVDLVHESNGHMYRLNGLRTREAKGRRVPFTAPDDLPDLEEILATDEPDRGAQFVAASYFAGSTEMRSRDELAGLLEELRRLDLRGSILRGVKGRKWVAPGPFRRLPAAMAVVGRGILQRPRETRRRRPLNV